MRFEKSTIARFATLILLPTWQGQAFSIQSSSRGAGTISSSSWSRQNAAAASKLYSSASDYDLGFNYPSDDRVEKSASDDRVVKSSGNKKSGEIVPIEEEPEFPVNFVLTDQWNYLHEQPKQKACDTHLIPTQVAYQCINKRGAIAHGRPTELQFDVNVKSKPIQSADEMAAEADPDDNDFYTEERYSKRVEDVFNELGGFKQLMGISDIKREIVKRGPVVSVSFQLTATFMNSSENRKRFDPSFINNIHPVAIIGWEHTDFGEVWLIQPLLRGKDADLQRIAFRQYGIDETVIAPIDTFDNVPWQRGPYFDIDLSDTPFPEWSTEWPGLETSITTAELENLGEVIADDLISPASNRSKFVMRDRRFIARSRQCYLTKLEWQNGDKAWRIEVSYLDN